MWVQHLSSLQFLSYVAFFAVVIVAVMRLLPGAGPRVRTEPYTEEELGSEDMKLGKYFVAGGAFLVLGGIHMVAKNLPWAAEWLARGGYAGHLVRDLSNTHVMIVGGGTLIATGLCWYVLPRIVGRPLASPGLAQASFWFTALGLLVFYVALVENGIAMSNLIAHGSNYEAAKRHMGDWYRVPVGMGAGVMGLGYWCFAANVFLTVFQGRLMRVPKPDGHLWKFLATGAGALTVGTVQGVIQVQPANASWLYEAGHAGEWIDPISHAHINLVTGLTMLVAGAAFYLLPRLGGTRPSARLANACFWSLLAGSLAFYFAALYLGFHEGRLVVDKLMTPEQAEEATALHPFLIMGGGIAMFAAFWFLLTVLVRSARTAPWPLRSFVFAGCGALALGTLQGPVQAFPAVNELLDRGGDAGDVVVNLHAQLNMLGGLMVILVGLALAVLTSLGAAWPERRARLALRAVSAGMLAYYGSGIAFAAVEAHKVSSGQTFAAAVSSLEPWSALVLVPASVAVLVGFWAYAAAAREMTRPQFELARRALAAMPTLYTGRIPRRVQRRSPAALAGYELPLGLLGFPGVGWLFAGFPFVASILLLAGPALAWAVVPIAFSPYGQGPLREIGWKAELVYLPLSALLSAALLYRAHAKRRRLLLGDPPRGRLRLRRPGSYRTRVSVAIGTIALVLVALPFVPALAGIGSSSVRYTYQPRLTAEVTGQFLSTPGGLVKLFSWGDPQSPYPADALRLHARSLGALVVRAAAVDDPAAYQLFDLGRGGSVPLRVVSASRTVLRLAPTRVPEPGRYTFVATHEGMFGGRDFAYITVVGPAEAATPIATGTDKTAPAVADTLLPLAAGLVALLFSGLLLTSFARRPAGQKFFWGVGFALFAVAALAEAAAQRSGWTPSLFRTYYLAGGVLTVACLGAGSAWLLLPPRGRDVLVGALATAATAATVTVFLAPVDGDVLAATASGRPPVNGALGGHAALWAISLNSFGTAFLVGGSLYSVLRRRRVRANVWIGLGAIVVALATGMSRAGDYSFVYIGELVGISIMFAGFRFTGAARKAAPAATSGRFPQGVPTG
jgi:Cytochrome C and Quinol oxidase polypeptide I